MAPETAAVLLTSISRVVVMEQALGMTSVGHDEALALVEAQLDRLVPVHRIADLTVDGPHLSRELMLIKVAGAGEERMEALRLADAFRARVVDATTESLVFEMTGAGEKLDAFVALMRPLGLKEICRTGVCAMARGPRGLNA